MYFVVVDIIQIDVKHPAYRESTHTIISVTFPYFMCNPP